MLAARDAGTNLAFFSGNEVYWKTRWEESQDGSHTPNRTLVCYKDTWANTRSTRHTHRYLARPAIRRSRTRSRELTHRHDVQGELGFDLHQGQLRRGKATALARTPRWTSFDSGTTGTLGSAHRGLRVGRGPGQWLPSPAALISMSTTTGPTPEYLTDFGNTVVPGTTTHHVTQYRAPSGALVFSAGTIQWAWGLDSHHDGDGDALTRGSGKRLSTSWPIWMPQLRLLPMISCKPQSRPTQHRQVTVTEPNVGVDHAPKAAWSRSRAPRPTPTVGAWRESRCRWTAAPHGTPADGRRVHAIQGVLYGSGPSAIQVRAIDDSANHSAKPGDDRRHV